MSPPSLSVVTTTDPVAGHLPKLLCRLSVLAEQRNELFEVVIVDDLKLWPSAESAPPLTLRGLKLRIIWYPERRGQLAAMLAGVQATSSDLVFTTDPDMYACINELPAMLEEMQESTALIHGIRSNRQDISPLRALGSQLANTIVRINTGLEVADFGSPVTLLRRDTVLPLMGEAGQLGNPRLFLYMRLGSALRTFTLRSTPPPRSTSQYTLFALIKLFFQLIQDSLAVRHKLSTIEAKGS